MSDRQVSHIVVEMLVATADQAGLSLAELCEGLPVEERALRRRLGGLEWDVATQLFERIEARIGPERLREFAGRVPDISTVGKAILGRFLHPRLMFRFVFRTIGPSMYPMYTTSYDEVERPDGTVEMRVCLRLKDGFRDCRTLFELHAVATAALPTLIGQPPAAVRFTTSGRGGDYWFTVPR